MTTLKGFGVPTDATFDLLLTHPKKRTPLFDKDGRQACVTLYGPDSKPAMKSKQVATQAALSRRNRAMDAEELEAQNIEFLVAITAGWYLVNFDGEVIEYEFTPNNARKLYANPEMGWLKDLVDEAAGNRANFLKTSEPKPETGPNTSSPSTEKTTTA